MTPTMTMIPSKPLPKENLTHILGYARQDFEHLRGARLFLTGGTGFFGKWLVTSFLHANRELRLGATLTVLTRNPARFRIECPHLVGDASLLLLIGDVRTFDFPETRFSHIIHGAAGSGAQPLEIFGTIVDGTRRILEFAAHCEAARILFLSSGAIYGPQPPGMTHIPETYLGGPDPLQLNSAYGEGKRAAEHLCCASSVKHRLEIVIARCFAFAGPYQPLNANFAIGNFIADVHAGREILIQGDGTPLRSYLFAADLAIWLWALLLRGQSGRAYNVGSDDYLTIADLAGAVAEASGVHHKIRTAKQSLPGAEPTWYVPSIERARTELGLEVRINLRVGLRKTLAWLG